MWDAVVVGAGPGGLSAALWLGRYRRSTLVLDDDRPRNEDAWAVHGYPGLPDPRPEELRQRLLDQALDAGIRLEPRRVLTITGGKGEFLVADDGGRSIRASRVVLAYGRTDRIPEIPGVKELYGRSVFHCPDCDGPTVNGQRLAVLGHDRAAARLALYLLTWAESVVLLTNGLEPDLDADALDTLARYSITIETGRIERLESNGGILARARLQEGEVRLDGAFFHWGSQPASALGQAAGCECGPTGDLQVDRDTMETTVPGIFAAGDIVGRPYLAVSAAAEGVRAALSVHRSLLPDAFLL